MRKVAALAAALLPLLVTSSLFAGSMSISIPANPVTGDLEVSGDVIAGGAQFSGDVDMGDTNALTGVSVIKSADGAATGVGFTSSNSVSWAYFSNTGLFNLLKGLTVTGSGVFTSNVAANAFIGDGSRLTGLPSGGSPSAIFANWYEHPFRDYYQPNQAQIGSDPIYVARQDYSNVTTRLNVMLPASVSGDVWTITHHAGPQTGTNVTFNMLYAFTKGQALPTSWPYTNSVTATWNATNMYDHAITHTLTNNIAGTNSVRLWITKGDSDVGSGYWYWGDTTIEVTR